MAVSRINLTWLLLFVGGVLLLAGVGVVGAQDDGDEDTEGMISIAATTFEMGAAADVMLGECNIFRDGCEISWFGASQPVHEVTVDPFSIDLYEVTNEAFLAFINELDSLDEGCDGNSCLTLADSQIELGDDGAYQVEDTYLDHPVAGATWYGASAFCEWRDARLPTEAEWELVASWDFESESKLTYPWGDEFDGEAVNFCDENCPEPQADPEYDDGFELTAPVGSYEDGRSSAGAYDMAGNLWEWVSDWYDPGYYADSPDENPQGPATGDNKVVRGGSWFDTGNFASTAIRFPAPPTESGDSIGFRCASDVVNEAKMVGMMPEDETPEPTATMETTLEPTATATRKPTATPTVEPTEAAPTQAPTATAEPTETPTRRPTATAEPTAAPTEEATATAEPTAAPTEEATATAEPTAAPTEEAESTEQSSSASSSATAPYFYCDLYPGEIQGDTYVVGACDSLIGIARKTGVSYTALLAANPQITDPNLIRMGEVITITGSAVSAPAAPAVASTADAPVAEPADAPPAAPSPPPPSPEPSPPPPAPPPATPSGSSLH